METVHPTLLILAAGLGSRYGGSKQVDPVGAHGACLFDYSIYDARKAGFGKIVFLISRAMEKEFKAAIANKYGANNDFIQYAYQALDDLPAGYRLPDERIKPWGTGHAVLAAREVIKEPFAVINADDYYGPGSFAAMADALKGCGPESREMVMVGFRLARTLSPHGHVSRGVCVTADGYLQSVIEREKVRQTGDGIVFIDPAGAQVPIAADSVVSMNFWGFVPRSIFPILDEHFQQFLSREITNPKAEFYIPLALDAAIAGSQIKVRVLESDEAWFGMTYAEDRAEVAAQLAQRTAQGAYPQNLFV